MSALTIILDGNQRSALAAVRALGRLGYPIAVAETSQPCLASSSKYCRARLIYPDPSTLADAFVGWLVEVGRRHPGAVLMPMTDLTVPLVLHSKHALPNLRTALPSLSAYEAVSDKYSLFELAGRAGIPVPRTLCVSRGNLESSLAQDLRLPIVIKPRRTVTRKAEKALTRTVRYAHSRQELRAQLDKILIDDSDELLLQEYVPGSGAGLFAMYRHGVPVFFFEHKRVREKPPSGGVSVLCESVALRDDHVQAARRILDPLHWHGVAMLEFRVDDSGASWLIEINARFWGSLQLAIDCDANFPALLYDTALGSTTTPPQGYHVGRQLRWLLGDIDNLYITLKRREFAQTARDRLAAIGRFCIPWRPGLRYELLRPSDPCPAVFAVRAYLSRAFGSGGDDAEGSA